MAEDGVSRALLDALQQLEGELQQTELYRLIRDFDASIARHWRATHYVASVKDLQGKLQEQLNERPEAKMAEAIAAMIRQRAAMKPEVEVNLMSGVTVFDWEMHLALLCWENEGGAAT